MPAVSVIMPVYNAATYLQKAIDSILHQTLSDFELIIVNDCSTDNSEAIIKAYNDPRIKYLVQQKNSGVVVAMNTGLQAVQSPYVAVMHADDVSFTDRLEKEFSYLEMYPQTAVIAGFIENINEADATVGKWGEDRKAITAAQIKAGMIKGNCIAHPSVMMRTDVVKQYGYTSSPNHKGYAVEDYPLWLHLLADGYVIEKIAEPLLCYRVHTQSATGAFLRSRNPFFVNYHSKKFYLEQRKDAGKWNGYDKKIQVSMYSGFVRLRNGHTKRNQAKIFLLKYKWYIRKRQLEDVFIAPFVLLGRMIAGLKPLAKEYETFFFFPFYHTGGAEKVHALVAQATGNSNCIIFFTRKSYDKNFYKDFVQSGCDIRDISAFTGSKFLYPINLIYRGIISGYINKQPLKTVVFNGQCNFGYKISPWINKAIPQVELIHSFNTFSWIRLPFLPFISRTMMISKLRIEDHLRQYKKMDVPLPFYKKIQYIVNGIPLPGMQKEKDYNGKLQVLYVGRGTEEKRVHIVAKMAEKAHQQKLPVDFVFMGDVSNAIPAGLLKYCKLIGHQTDSQKIDDEYWQSHIVVITSYTEGFPLAIEEGMARGCAVMATAVGDIPVHVKNIENGLLFSSVDNQETIIDEGVEFLALLCDNKKPLQEISIRNWKYAVENFGIEAFNNSYQQLFHQLRNL